MSAPAATSTPPAAATPTPAADPLSKPPKKKRMPSTLTSEVYNEAELIFQILEHKDKKLISYLDCLTLLRGMGMNPTTDDMDQLHETMKQPIAELEAIRLAEEVKREKERKAAEKKDPKKEKEAKEKAEKEAKEKEAAEKEAAEKGEGAPKKKVLAEPAEEIKNIDWNIFIHAVEPIYKNNQVEEEEIIAALRVFDTTGKGSITRAELEKAVTESGESVLSPAEKKQLREAFPGDVIEFSEFAKRLQGTYQGPSPEELAKKAEAERLAKEEAAKAAASNPTDDLLSSALGTSSNVTPPSSA